MDPRNGLGHSLPMQETSEEISLFSCFKLIFFSTLTVIYLSILALFYYIFLKMNILNEDKNSTWATYHIADIY